MPGLSAFVPQIAGSYRGSYFSMTGFADPQNRQMVVMPLVSLPLSPFMISVLGCSWLPLPPCLVSFVSLHDLHSGLLLAAAAAALSPFICLSSWSPFRAVLGCRCRLVSQACLPNDLHSGLFLAAAAAALSPKLVALHDLRSGLLLAAAAALSPKLVSLHDRICLIPFLFFLQFGLVDAAAALSPFVSLHDLHSGLLLAAAAALPPKLVSLHELHSGLLAPGRRCRLVSQVCLSSWSPLWAALSWLPPCLPSLSSLWSHMLSSFLVCFFCNLGG